MTGIPDFNDCARVEAVARWLSDASEWMADMVTSRADYPQRRNRVGEIYPVRFRVGELDEFLTGLETAAGVMRAISSPSVGRVQNPNPSTQPDTHGRVVDFAAERARRHAQQANGR
jgi:hypothetical protein